MKVCSSRQVGAAVLRIAQSALLFTSLADLFIQTPSQLLWEASSNMLHLMREDCSYTYPPLSIARYSFIQLSELEQCRAKKLAQCFNTAAQDLNPGPLSRESKALPLSHCAYYNRTITFANRLCFYFLNWHTPWVGTWEKQYKYGVKTKKPQRLLTTQMWDKYSRIRS